jgi:hypothetical protein
MISAQAIALFISGVLVGALLLGGGSFNLPWSGDGAQAQNANTWQMELMRGNFEQDVPQWITSLPAACDLVVDPNVGARIFYYRCPQ